MTRELLIYVESDALLRLVDYCDRHNLRRFYLVADQNTYRALGKLVEETMTGRGFDIKTILLTGDEIVPDERYIMQALLQVEPEDRVYLAVASGTITDIVRFISHRTKTSFISVPTAPSVDGYTSGGAPLVIGGLKQTVYTQPPIAVFGDLNTLCAAPRPMIAAGFGDMLGKYTALADWKLGRLLWDEPYSETIAQRVWNALQDCVQRAAEIGAASPQGIRSLMAGLIETGLCMLDFGASPPASAAEHYLSHYWEMKLLQENRPAILHGAKVGVACIIVTRFYEKVRQLSRAQAADMLQAAPLPDRDQDLYHIRSAYPAIADKIIAEQKPFLELTEAAYGRLKQNIVDHWASIQEIAAIVPSSQHLTHLLRQVGGPVTTGELGLSNAEVAMAVEYTHYFRNRFTVLKLSRMLGIPLRL